MATARGRPRQGHAGLLVAFAVAPLAVLAALVLWSRLLRPAAAPSALPPPRVQAAPLGGVYPGPQRVTLTASEPSTIYSTRDGSDPTTSPTRAAYLLPLAIAASTPLRFVAITPDQRRSPVMSVGYTIATTAGFRDLAYDGASAPTAKDAESKLWFAAGAWWGVLYHSAAPKGWRIDRLDPTTQRWIDGGAPTLDARPGAKFDVLADGDALDVVSHLMQGPDQQDVSGRRRDDGAAQFQRLRYDAARQTYRIYRPPRPIAPGTMETFVLAHDTTGTLWGVFTQDNVVTLVHTLGNTDAWTAPYRLPTAGAAVSSDDIAAIVAFGGKIGVLWSNQCPDHHGCPAGVTTETMYFAWHADGTADDAWTAEVAYAVPGKKGADDHINLTADAAGRVYAAVKTSFTQPTDPLVNLLVRSPDGRWRSVPVWTVADGPTRPIVLLDEAHDQLFLFATAPETGGAIYGKHAPLSDLAFPSGRGTPILASTDDPAINNVTATKQAVDARSGLVLLAGDDTTHRYLHATITLSGRPFGGTAVAAVPRATPGRVFGAPEG